ncbi:penicillin-insensitive murein endopeptidase [Granulibacter bethesdensis]|uniref:penicillin-insensitive murein endopeptidase n=1 Tax=Granulibacter bethesdensis TaxID=364410 RepID=UPI0003F1F320|nr:penicillin-insensitive murein endopeptidase [Granulibacter bethesdensis]AHJ68733.1 Penicillin-insensitive D-alanyl-meso-diaminopimelate endopeptidase [Granulibacter bethesdensis]
MQESKLLVGIVMLLSCSGMALSAPVLAQPVQIIGPAGNGCIAGAQRLPDEGPGWQTIRRDRSSFWSAPVTINGVKTLAARLRSEGLPDLYVGDMSAPHGGRLPGGHGSHQNGLDVDLYLDLTPRPALTPDERNVLEPPSMVSADGNSLSPAWTQDTVTLLHMAATLPNVDRVLVNPVIKRALCEQVSGDRSWLHLIRPWWGHKAHMHVRFRCPAGQTLCVQAPPPPTGDGCDTTLAWWFQPHPAPPAAPPRPPEAPPAACRPILAGDTLSAPETRP